MTSLGSEAQLIVNFLKTAPKSFFSEREIARKAGLKRQFRENPDWAKPILLRLADENTVETDAFGHYRITPEPEQAKRRSIPLAPSVKEILDRNAKTFDLADLFADVPTDNVAAKY